MTPSLGGHLYSWLLTATVRLHIPSGFVHEDLLKPRRTEVYTPLQNSAKLANGSMQEGSILRESTW